MSRSPRRRQSVREQSSPSSGSDAANISPSRSETRQRPASSRHEATLDLARFSSPATPRTVARVARQFYDYVVGGRSRRRVSTGRWWRMRGRPESSTGMIDSSVWSSVRLRWDQVEPGMIVESGMGLQDRSVPAEVRSITPSGERLVVLLELAIETSIETDRHRILALRAGRLATDAVVTRSRRRDRSTHRPRRDRDLRRDSDPR